jgi:hypothetical protein
MVSRVVQNLALYWLHIYAKPHRFTKCDGRHFKLSLRASSPFTAADRCNLLKVLEFLTCFEKLGRCEDRPLGSSQCATAVTGAGLILQGLSGPNFNQVFSVDASGNLNISGNLVVSGTKSSTAKLQNGQEVALYALESPENWFEDFGSAELMSGVACVPLDTSFAEATNAAVIYHVFLTPNGDSNGLYVARKTPAGFEVREHGGGGFNVAFDYRIVVKRRGYEVIRMAVVQSDAKTVESSRQHLAQLANSEPLQRQESPKCPQLFRQELLRLRSFGRRRHSSILAAATCTSSGMKALCQHHQSLFSSFRTIRSSRIAGLTFLQPRKPAQTLTDVMCDEESHGAQRALASKAR